MFNNEKAAFLGLSAVNAMELLIGNFSSDAQFSDHTHLTELSDPMSSANSGDERTLTAILSALGPLGLGLTHAPYLGPTAPIFRFWGNGSLLLII